MRTLDRYVVRNFLVSLGLWFIVLMVLRVSIDLFINVDEFAEGRLPLATKIAWTGEYYAYHSLVYFDEMGGLMIVVAATFAVALMNRSNELTAMLASGVSLHRVVWPIVLCAILVEGVMVTNKELLVPRFARELSRSRDYIASEKEDRPRVLLPQDNAGTVWWSPQLRSRAQTLEKPIALIRDQNLDLYAGVYGRQAQWQALDGQPGWAFSDARIDPAAPGGAQGSAAWPHMQSAAQIYSLQAPEGFSQSAGKVVGQDPTYAMSLQADSLSPAGPETPALLSKPRFTFFLPEGQGRQHESGRVVAVVLAREARWVVDGADSRWILTEGRIWVPSDMTPREILLRPSRNWLDYLSSLQLSELLTQRSLTNRRAVLLARHVQVTSPINHLIMLLLALPFILSRERNIKASAGMAVLVVGGQLAVIYLCRYVALPPMWSAWLPILIFGPLAVLALDSIKT